MAGTGIFVESVNAVKTALTGLGIPTVTDPRNARPLTAFIEAPTFDMFAGDVSDISITVRLLAPPPGNDDALQWLLTKCDAITNSSLAVTAGQPSTAIIGEQQLPAYDLTIRVSTRRT